MATTKPLNNGWRRTPLGDFVTLRRGHDLPESARRPGETPVIGSFGLTGWHDEPRTQGPGVTVGRSGASLGVVSYTKVDYWPHNTVLYVTDFHGNDARFAYYLLKQFDFRAYNSGSVQPSLNRNFIHPIPFDVPPLTEQRAIAHILGMLDDGIELKRRMNQTLETIVRHMFKHWFVDFGPTVAKAGGCEPYLSAGIWELFPNSLDGEGRPVGWTPATVADVAVSPTRGVDPADVAADTPYIGLEHMPRRSIALTEWSRASTVTSGKSAFTKGEILFGKLRPYFHKVGLAPLDGICSTDIVVVAPRGPEWRAFALLCLSSDEFVSYTDQTSTGTKMPRTSWKTMAQYQVCLPPNHVARAFQALVQPLIDKAEAATHQSHTLARIRDLLLPKLISGEIRVAEAEKAVEAVT